jgi:hypothetical protein
MSEVVNKAKSTVGQDVDNTLVQILFIFSVKNVL